MGIQKKMASSGGQFHIYVTYFSTHQPATKPQSYKYRNMDKRPITATATPYFIPDHINEV